MTGETLTDPAALRAQLAEVRRTGLAEEAEEAVLGECGVAAASGAPAEKWSAPSGSSSR